jgi:hypothetical protein
LSERYSYLKLQSDNNRVPLIVRDISTSFGEDRDILVAGVPHANRARLPRAGRCEDAVTRRAVTRRRRPALALTLAILVVTLACGAPPSVTHQSAAGLSLQLTISG